MASTKTILAIETSCDETAAAIIEYAGGRRARVRVLSSLVSSQVRLHARFGGVVPNLARREHEKNLVPILMRALREAGLQNSKFKIQNSKVQIKIQKLREILRREPELLLRFLKHIAPLPKPAVDAVAVTAGPGLAPALWTGVNCARALAFWWDVPLIPVNHMEGHLVSALLRKQGNEKSQFSTLNFRSPALALLVSGGHTELVLAKKIGAYTIIGETLDDAAGEAFDKVARILGLGYPGGPEIARAAAKAQNSKLKITLPRPMANSGDHDFSFSGLKTAVLYRVRDLKNAGHSIKKLQPAFAREFQNAAVEVLVKKTIRAAKAYVAKTIILGGGVAANALLREKLGAQAARELPGVQTLAPSHSLTGDNALMIALAAALAGKAKRWQSVVAEPTMRLSR